jgi:putative endonuclease
MHAHLYYVYIIECSDHSYYVGVTNDLERRIWEHQEGIDLKSYTFPRRPVQLRYSETYSNILDAIAREKQLKGWTRKKKEALINENWEALKERSRNKEHGF